MPRDWEISKKHAGGEIGSNCHPLVTKRTESNLKGTVQTKGAGEAALDGDAGAQVGGFTQRY